MNTLRFVTIGLFSLASISFFYLPACSQNDNTGNECWVHTYKFGPMGIWECGGFSDDVCIEVGSSNGEKIYRCPCPVPCECPDSPPTDGGFERYGCEWERDYCYEGPPTNFYPIGSCTCWAHYPCWTSCLGYPGKDGGFSCSLDGGTSVCFHEPELDEDNRAVFCEIGPWPVLYEQ